MEEKRKVYYRHVRNEDYWHPSLKGTIATVIEGNKISVGVALCKHNEEKFVKEIGRKYALTRAIKSPLFKITYEEGSKAQLQDLQNDLINIVVKKLHHHNDTLIKYAAKNKV